MSDSTTGNTRVTIMRSKLGQVRGAGAGSGVHHWYVERLTSVALIPLTLWFVYVVLHLAGQPHAEMVKWAGNPVNAVLMLALIAITFHHMQLGIQVVLEDYVHVKWMMSAAILANKAAALLLGLASALAVLKLALARVY